MARFATVVGLVAMLVGCTQGSAPTGASSAAETPGGGASGGGLSGTVVLVAYDEDHIVDSKAGIQIVDLATGKTARIEKDVGSIWPTTDGSTWIAQRDGDSRATEDVVDLMDNAGHVTKSISLPLGLRNTPKLSPDRKRIAVGWYDKANGEYSPDTKLTIFDLQGNILARLDDATGYEWMPDGRLLYGLPGKVVIGDASGAHAKTVKTLDGNAFDLAVNRSGTQIAFGLAHPNADSIEDTPHVYLMNADGTGMKQLTKGKFDEGWPFFIGDSGWLLVTSNLSSTPNGYDSIPLLFAVPTDRSEPMELEEHAETAAVPIKIAWPRDGMLTAHPLAPPAWVSN